MNPESVQDLRLAAGCYLLFCSQRSQGEKALCKQWGRVVRAPFFSEVLQEGVSQGQFEEN